MPAIVGEWKANVNKNQRFAPSLQFLAACASWSPPAAGHKWVPNAKAAGEVTRKKGNTRQKYRPRLMTPAEKPEILKAYLDIFRREVQRYSPSRPDPRPKPSRNRPTAVRPSNSSQYDSSPCFSNHSGSAEAEGTSLPSYPAHTNTGNLGYFSNRASLSASSHLTNTEPRSDCTRRAWRQFVQSPAYPGSIEISPFIHEE